MAVGVFRFKKQQQTSSKHPPSDTSRDIERAPADVTQLTSQRTSSLKRNSFNNVSAQNCVSNTQQCYFAISATRRQIRQMY